MPYFHHDDLDFYYEQQGNGPHLVFTHGLMGELAQFQGLLGNLPDWSIVCWECRGHGRTGLGAAAALTFQQFADDLRSLLLHLELESAVVGGVSMGAGVATRFAIDWPEMVNGLILVRPAWLDQKSPDPLKATICVGDLLASYGAEHGRHLFEKSAEYTAAKREDLSEAESLCLQFERPDAVQRAVCLQRMPRDCPIHNWAEVDRILQPALVIGCENDPVHPLPYALEWSRRLQHSQFVAVPSKLTDLASYQQAVRTAIADFLHHSLNEHEARN